MSRSSYELLTFNIHENDTGSLVALEKGKNFPFNVKRFYYLWGTKANSTRGKHAHKNLEQVIICVSGSCDFILDNGKTCEKISLNKPNQGLYIKNSYLWREFKNFSTDCVLVVLASEFYKESDYIRNYEEFLKEVNL